VAKAVTGRVPFQSKESRGLTEKVARKLVIRGFMGQILAKMPTKEARQTVIDEIERKLQYEGN